MRTGRPRKFELTLTEAEHAQPSALATSGALPHGLVRRAQMILPRPVRRTSPSPQVSV